MLVGLAIYHFGRHLLPPDMIRKNDDGTQHVRSKIPLSGEDYRKIGALVFLCIINIAFWSVYEQQGNTLQLWADSKIDWNLGGFLVPSTWYQSLNPLFIFILVPVMTAFWGFQGRRKMEPNSVSKMAIGCVFTGVSFLAMYYATDIIGAGQGSMFWLVGTVLLLTIGELYISPVGLSLVSKLSPIQLISMLMGMWFMSSFFGGFLAGYIGSFYEVMGQKDFFLLCTGLSFAAAAVFYISKFPLKRLISHND
jgi:POT family proton-dependent oligopeptide transporter